MKLPWMHFLQGNIRFSDIAKVNASTLNQLEPMAISSIQQVLEIDRSARAMAKSIIDTLPEHHNA